MLLQYTIVLAEKGKNICFPILVKCNFSIWLQSFFSFSWMLKVQIPVLINLALAQVVFHYLNHKAEEVK